MKPFFSPNISNLGRLVRGIGGVGLLIGAWFELGVSVWVGILLAVAGCFVLFEAVRGWCVLRACGLKTKL